jgi:membrane protein DedA with SNARE-associated domain
VSPIVIYALILVVTTIGCAGIPLPSAAVLGGAAIAASVTHQLDIKLVIALAAIGATLGTVIGFLAGRMYGMRLITRFGDRIGLSERRLKTAYYILDRYGTRVVLFGCFLGPLRTWRGMLSGIHRLAWPRFLVANVCGAVAWAVTLGVISYALGDDRNHLLKPEGIGGAVLVLLLLVGLIWYLRRWYRRLAEEAARAMPGPLSTYMQIPAPPPCDEGTVARSDS